MSVRISPKKFFIGLLTILTVAVLTVTVLQTYSRYAQYQAAKEWQEESDRRELEILRAEKEGRRLDRLSKQELASEIEESKQQLAKLPTDLVAYVERERLIDDLLQLRADVRNQLDQADLSRRLSDLEREARFRQASPQERRAHDAANEAIVAVIVKSKASPASAATPDSGSKSSTVPVPKSASKPEAKASNKIASPPASATR